MSKVAGKLVGRFIGWCPVPMWESEHCKTHWTNTTMKLMESPDVNAWTMYDPLTAYFVVCETEHPFTEHLSHVSCLENIDVPEDIWKEIIVRRVLKQL